MMHATAAFISKEQPTWPTKCKKKADYKQVQYIRYKEADVGLVTCALQDYRSQHTHFNKCSIVYLQFKS